MFFIRVAPSRARGLKLIRIQAMLDTVAVAPSRARGLKRSNHLRGPIATRRRAFTGAWIETLRLELFNDLSRRRAFTGAWIETYLCCAVAVHFGCRAFTGAWIETT